MKQAKFTLLVAAYTEEMLRHKRKAVEWMVVVHAATAALNGLNPIPGLDIAVDLAMLTNMANMVVSAYGLRPEQLAYAARGAVMSGAVHLIKQAGRVSAEYLGREAVQAALMRMAPRVLGPRLLKYVPYFETIREPIPRHCLCTS